MRSKSLKVSWIILLIPHTAVLINGLMWTFAPNVFLDSWIKPFVGETWANFTNSDAAFASLIQLLGLYVGIMVIIIGFVAITVTLTAYKKGEKWAWYLALSGNAVGFVSSIIIYGIIGDMATMVVNVVLFIVALVALTIGARYILQKTSA